MSRKSVLAVSCCAAAVAVLAGPGGANADKSLRPFADSREHYGEPYRERPEGVQIFVGRPYFYDGYRPYYGPYVYGPLGRAGTDRPFVGPNYRGDPADCRRWAWAYGRLDKGQWRCAEW